MLEAGSVGDCRTLAAVLGRNPRPVEQFVDDRERTGMRSRAQLDWLLPLLRYAVAAMWIATGLVSAFVFPLQESLALLARTGLHGELALAALYGAASFDVALGLAGLFDVTRRWAYRIQLLLIGAYTIIITVCLPEYWAHPYGPILKNIPLVAAIGILYYLDEGHGPTAR